MFQIAENDALMESWYDALAYAQDQGEPGPTFQEHVNSFSPSGMTEADIEDEIPW